MVSKKNAFWLFYIAFTVLFVSLVTETFVRVWIIQKDFLYFKVYPGQFPHFGLVEKYAVDDVTISNGRRELGVRGKRKWKVAFVGDSNTFGTGSNDQTTISELIQGSQNEWDAYNFGVPGYGLPEILSVVDRVTASEKNHVIAYNWNFNDVLVAMSLFLPLLTTPETRLAIIDNFEGRYGMAKLFAKDHLKSLFVIPSILHQRRQLEQMASSYLQASVGNECVPSPLPYIDSDGKLPKFYALINQIYSNELLMNQVRNHFKKMKELASERGSKLVIFPHYDMPFFTHLDDYSARIIANIAKELGIEFLETRSVYDKHWRECSFFDDAGHLGPKGNRYIAQELEKYLAGQI